MQHHRVLQLKPADSLAAEALGRSLFYAGQPSAGSTHYQRALALIPNNAEVHFNFGRNLELFGAPSTDLAQMHASHWHFGAAQTLATASWRERTGLQLRYWKKRQRRRGGDIARISEGVRLLKPALVRDWSSVSAGNGAGAAVHSSVIDKGGAQYGREQPRMGSSADAACATSVSIRCWWGGVLRSGTGATDVGADGWL